MKALMAGGKTMTGKMIPSIDNRLMCWAEWKVREADGDAGIGYGRSMVATLIESQGVVVRSTAVSSSMPDAIYDTDKAVRLVAEKQPALAQVINEEYINATSTREQRRVACGCSLATYKRRLAQAHYAVQMLLPRSHRRGRLQDRAREVLLDKAG